MNTSAALAVDENLLNLFRRAGDLSSFENKLNDVYYEMAERLRKLLNFSV